MTRKTNSALDAQGLGRKTTRAFNRLVIGSATLLVASGPVRADVEMINSGSYEDGANWSTGNVPVAADDVTIGTTANPGLAASVPTAVGALGNELTIGDTADGLINVTGGTLDVAKSILGATSGVTGTALMTGGLWANSSDLRIGSFGTGSVMVTGGSLSTSTGTIGFDRNSIGALSVSGPGSSVEAASLFFVGFGGAGQLTVANGGTARFLDMLTLGTNFIGVGTASVGGVGSTLEVATFLNVGLGGRGTLDVTDGGSVSSATGSIATEIGSIGTVAVTGVDARLTAPNLNVGFDGAGSLDIGGGGTVTTATNLVLGVRSGSSGTLNLNADGVLKTNTLFVGAGSAEVNFNGGTLQVLDATFATALPLTLGAETTSKVDTNGQTARLDGVISGAGSLEKRGAGTLTLGGANLYSGGTTVTEGTLQLATFTALGASSGSLVVSGGSVDLNGQSATVGSLSGAGGSITNQKNDSISVLTVQSSGNTQYDGTIDAQLSGRTVGLVKSGAGTLTLTGSNAYSAGTTVTDGTLAVAGPNARIDSLGRGDFTVGRSASDDAVLSVSAGGQLSAQDLTIGRSASSTGLVEVSGGGSAVRVDSLQVGDAGGGTLSVSDGALVESNFGVVGGIENAAGSVAIAGTDSSWVVDGFLNVGAGGVGEVDVSAGGRLDSTETATLGSAATGVGTGLVRGAGSVWRTGNILNVGGDGTGSVTVSNGGSLETVGTGSLGTNQTGSGSVVVEGTGSQWHAPDISVGFRGDGELEIKNGGLVTATSGLGVAVRSGSSGMLNLDEGGTLRTNNLFAGDGSAQINFNGGTLQVLDSNLTTAAAITLGDGSTSTVDTNGQNATLAGVLSGAGGIEKSGLGTLVLAGGNNFSGDTKISGGTLRLATFSALGTDTSSLAVEAGVLDLGGQSITVGRLSGASGIITNAQADTISKLTVANSGETQFDGTFDARIAGQALGLTKRGAGTLILTGASAYTGETVVSEGVLTIRGSGAAIDGLSAGNLRVGTEAGKDGTVRVEMGAEVSANNVNVGGPSSAVGEIFVEGTGSVLRASSMEVGAGGTGGLTASSGADVATGSITVGNAAGSVGSVEVQDSGTVFGVTGFLNVGSGGAGDIVVSDGAELRSSDTATLGANALGTGDVTVRGVGSLWRNGNFLNVGADGSGVVTVTAGARLVTVASGTLGTGETGDGAVTVSGRGSEWDAKAINVGFRGGGQLDVRDGGTVVAADGVGIGVLAGSQGAVTIGNGGTLRTTNVFAGVGEASVTMSGGTLQADGAGLTSSVDIDLTADTISSVDTNGRNAALAGIVGGNGALRKTGEGTLTLAGANSYLGGTTVSAGTLAVDGDQHAASGDVLVESQGTLSGVGILGGRVAIDGALRPGDGVGNLTLAILELNASALTSLEIESEISFDTVTSLSTFTLGGVLELLFEAALENGASLELFLSPDDALGNFSRVAIGGAAYAPGDFIQDGNLWRNQQGETELVFDALSGTLTVVPEPQTIALAVLGAIALLFARVRNIRRRV